MNATTDIKRAITEARAMAKNESRGRLEPVFAILVDDGDGFVTPAFSRRRYLQPTDDIVGEYYRGTRTDRPESVTINATRGNGPLV